MATQEQFAALMAQTSALTAAVAQMADLQQGAASKGSPKGGKVIDARHLRLATFDGTSSRYDEWSFSVKRAIRSASCATYKLLAQVEVEPAEVQEDQMTDEFEGLKTESISAEIYDLLCQSCSGEALACFRAVDDMRGLTAWQRLYRKFNPKTMARAIRLVGAVTRPPKIKEIMGVEAGLDRWQEHLKVLKRDFAEDFSPTVLAGIATAMMPESIQELVYTNLGSGAVNYEETVAKIRALVSNKVAMAEGPSPMEVDRVAVKTELEVERRDTEEEWEQEVDAVNMGHPVPLVRRLGALPLEMPDCVGTRAGPAAQRTQRRRKELGERRGRSRDRRLMEYERSGERRRKRNRIRRKGVSRR